MDYFVHLVLELFGILIVHPVFFPQLLHHCRRLLVTLFGWLLLLNPILVPDILTHLQQIQSCFQVMVGLNVCCKVTFSR